MKPCLIECGYLNIFLTYWYLILTCQTAVVICNFIRSFSCWLLKTKNTVLFAYMTQFSSFSLFASIFIKAGGM